MWNSYDIARSRQIARMYVRLIALVLAIIFVIIFLHEIHRKLFYDYGEWLNWTRSDTAEMSTLLVIAGLILLFERRLIAWLVPLPKNECPACGYSLEHITSEKCPECGIPLTTRWSDAKPDSTANSERSSP